MHDPIVTAVIHARKCAFAHAFCHWFISPSSTAPFLSFSFQETFSAAVSFALGVLVMMITENKARSPWQHTCWFLQTDTASVLQETIGYIRFLLSQIEVQFQPFSLIRSIYISLHQSRSPFRIQIYAYIIQFLKCSHLQLYICRCSVLEAFQISAVASC